MFPVVSKSAPAQRLGRWGRQAPEGPQGANSDGEGEDRHSCCPWARPCFLDHLLSSLNAE
jgi:hypothetical protein